MFHSADITKLSVFAKQWLRKRRWFVILGSFVIVHMRISSKIYFRCAELVRNLLTHVRITFLLNTLKIFIHMVQLKLDPTSPIPCLSSPAIEFIASLILASKSPKTGWM